MDSIKDANGYRVAFGYLGPRTARIVSRTNRINAVTKFRYDAGMKMSSSRLDLSSTDSIVTRVRAAETMGLATSESTGAVVSSLVSTQLDGPRTDANDITQFYLGRFGTPIRIVNALGDTTTFVRGDSNFPALVTKVRYPNGRIVGASFDTRGNVVQSTDSSDYRDGSSGRRYATTTYTWDMRWDAVASITTPEGVITTFAYDTLTGNRKWQQIADPTHRVNFGYDSRTGQLVSVKEPGVGVADSIRYGKLGNPTFSVNSSGIRTQFFNDAIGRVIRSLIPIDSAQTRFQENRTSYDVMDRAISSVALGPVDTI